MTSKTEDQISLPLAIRKSAIGLAIFAFFTAGIIAITQQLTKDTIAQNEREFEARLLLSLLPEDYLAEDILASSQTFSDSSLFVQSQLSIENSESFYQELDSDGDVASVILPAVAPEGYTEGIRLIIGISANGELTGVRVTRHKETPGLGDQIETSKSDWVLQFNQKSLTNPQPNAWAVKKDGGSFDQLTGATITPRAIVKAVKNALSFFEEHKETLLTPYTESGAQNG